MLGRIIQIAALGFTVALVVPTELSAEPLRLATDLFGARAEIEVRDLPREEGEKLIREAFELIAELERMVDRDSGVLAELNRKAGQGPQPTPEPLLALLVKALDFCSWSAGAHGPLGGRLYDLWGRGEPIVAPPAESLVVAAQQSASCDRLKIDLEAGTAELASDSALDLDRFAIGAAVDRAIDHLRASGSANAWVGVGPVERGFGAGPGGSGWFVRLKRLEGESTSLSDVYLRDRAVAVAGSDDRPLRVAGDPKAPFIDQRPRQFAPISAQPGAPREGILAVAVVTELAADAQGLAGALFVLGSIEGQFRLGSLRPAPAALWLLGGAGGEPIVTSSHWSQIHQ